MESGEDRCPKCGGAKESGFLLDRILRGQGGKPLLWVEAAQISHSLAVKPGDDGQVEVDAYRCVECGYLELFAGMRGQVPE